MELRPFLKKGFLVMSEIVVSTLDGIRNTELKDTFMVEWFLNISDYGKVTSVLAFEDSLDYYVSMTLSALARRNLLKIDPTLFFCDLRDEVGTTIVTVGKI